MMRVRAPIVAVVLAVGIAAVAQAQEWPSRPIEINKALGEAAVYESFLQSAQEPVGGSQDQFARLVRNDFDNARLVKELNIQVEAPQEPG